MKHLSDIDFLKAVREKLSDPTRWNRGEFAINKRGRPVYPESSEAVQWCLLGAADSIDHEPVCQRPIDCGSVGAFRLSALLEPFLGRPILWKSDTSNIAKWNDEKGRRHVSGI